MDCISRPTPKQEDEVISRLIDLHGTNQWTTIATEMKSLIPSTRSSKQIRERYPLRYPDGTTNSTPASPKPPGYPTKKPLSLSHMPKSATSGKTSQGNSRAEQTMQSKTTSTQQSVGP